jgi:hypothetical protein
VDHTGPSEAFGDQSLHVALADRFPPGEPPLDEAQGLVLGRGEGGGRPPMGPEVGVRPRHERLQEVPRADDVDAEGAHEVDGPRVDLRDVGVVGVLGVLYGHPAGATEHVAQPVDEGRSIGVRPHLRAQVRDRPPLYGVHQEHEGPLLRHPKEPPAGQDDVLQPEHAGRERVGPPEVVEQPAVQLRRSQLAFHRFSYPIVQHDLPPIWTRSCAPRWLAYPFASAFTQDRYQGPHNPCVLSSGSRPS